MEVDDAGGASREQVSSFRNVAMERTIAEKQNELIALPSAISVSYKWKRADRVPNRYPSIANMVEGNGSCD